MRIRLFETSELLGAAAAKHAAASLNRAIAENGYARIVLSTGASQFDMFKELVLQPVDWSKVEMFHLDEYLGLPESHPASFRKYLKEKFTAKVPLLAAHFVDGEGDYEKKIKELSARLEEKPVDVALIGIGENSHIAFNDPPADFDTRESYIVVNLDNTCKEQQVREGWFATVDDVPKQAITMTTWRIMQSREIISVVPHTVKARAVLMTLENEPANTVPATLLKTHDKWTLYIDKNSASETPSALIEPLL